MGERDQKHIGIERKITVSRGQEQSGVSRSGCSEEAPLRTADWTQAKDGATVSHRDAWAQDSRQRPQSRLTVLGNEE